jgi:pyruvate-formate lyase
MTMDTPRLTALRETLGAHTPAIWEEPFHDAWQAGLGLDTRVRFAEAQAAEMAAARPFVKPGELIIGNNALCPAVTGMPTPYRTGVRLDRARLAALRRERPEAAARLDEIEHYWSAWLAENSSYLPMTCHAAPAYGLILELGVDGLRRRVKEWRAINASLRPDCAPWYDALLIVLKGMSAYILAHARAADEAAAVETAHERRAELARIAAACRHVAHRPPRSFFEAAQLFYLVFQLYGHDSPGPIDRILYPAYRRDVESGALTRDEAQEILDCLWLKFEEKEALGATIGGQLRDGSDSSNELSLLCVSSIKRLRLLSPRTALRWHRGLQDELLNATVDSIASGATYPALVNDEAIIPAMLERGVSVEDAREYTFVGCGQVFPYGRGAGNYEDVVINAAKPLELALNDGVDPISGQRMGPATGAPETFGTYEAFERAYRQQMDHHIDQHIRWVNEHRARTQGRAFDFLRSLLTQSCVERGLDWHAGGAKYNEGMVDMVGMATLTDSLVAIRRGVFEHLLVSLPELAGILNRNWDGAEALRLTFLRKLPKFGNEDALADGVAADEVARVNDVIRSHRTHFGGPWGMDIIGWSGAVEMGAHTGATPDGRCRGEALADCAGPAQGRNTHGLTPTLLSTLKLPHARAHGPLALSLRFPKDLVQGAEGRARLRAVIEAYFHQGGQQLQISIASSEDMRAAQQNPEAYGWLMVRVGGFSAYFTQLDRRWQDDMIARSEMEL